MALDHRHTCGEMGPTAEVVKGGRSGYHQLICNRVKGHEGEHQQRERDNFALLGSWPVKTTQLRPVR